MMPKLWMAMYPFLITYGSKWVNQHCDYQFQNKFTWLPSFLPVFSAFWVTLWALKGSMDKM